MKLRNGLVYFIDGFVQNIGSLAGIFSVGLALLVFYDAMMRYLFSAGSVALQELEWHLFAALFLLGLAYTLKQDKHVRVDIFYERFSSDGRHIINFFAVLLTTIPFSLIMLWFGNEMVIQSFFQHERSADPGGLGSRWIIKSVLVVGFALLLLQSLAELFKHYERIRDKRRLLRAALAIAVVSSAIFIGWFFDMPYPIDPVYLMFAVAFVGLMIGIPVAFVFGATALLFACIDENIGLHVLEMLPYRTYGIMSNVTLMAVPLFIMMGLILEKSKMAEALLESMGRLFGPIRGGIAISVVLVGAVLAASTGIVGASVVMMSLIALPLMLRNGYAPSLAAGSIAASGTLGQLIPPSIVLIVLGDQMHLSVGDLFKAAVAPGLLLIVLYIVYIVVLAWFAPHAAPAMRTSIPYKQVCKEALGAIAAPLLLIIAVLGSIFAGIASPTESAAVGVVGAVLLAWKNGVLGLELIGYAARETVKLSAMIFMILIGATAFSLVFNELDGGDMALHFFTSKLASPSAFVWIAMGLVFLLGFFIDFIEIAFVVVPILVPIVASFGIDPIWFAVLLAMNLQASFLTPPFGFALFYLKGAAGDKISTIDIYKGVVPFIVLQLIALCIVYFYPNIIYWFGK